MLRVVASCREMLRGAASGCELLPGILGWSEVLQVVASRCELLRNVTNSCESLLDCLRASLSAGLLNETCWLVFVLVGCFVHVLRRLLAG